MINDYYHHVKKSKTLDLQREFIVTIGDKDDWDRLTRQSKLNMGKILANYVRGFNKRHPHFHCFNAVVHLDEVGAPHLHFNVVPVATGYKKGMAIQPSFKKALENEGYKGVGKNRFTAFRNEEIDILTKELEKYGIKRKLVGTNDIKDVWQYKQVQQDLEKLNQEIREAKADLKTTTGEQKYREELLENVSSSLNKLNREIAGGKKDLQKTNAQAKELQEQVSSLNSQKTELEKDVARLRGQHLALRPIDNTLTNRASKLLEVLNNAKERLIGGFIFESVIVTQIKEFVQTVYDTIKPLIAQNNALRQELWETKNKTEDLSSRNGELYGKVCLLEDKVRGLEFDKQELEDTVQEAENIIGAFQNRFGMEKCVEIVRSHNEALRASESLENDLDHEEYLGRSR